MSNKYLFYECSKKDGKLPQGWMFSNFSPHPIAAYGIVWPTSEHLFQALKFKGTDDEYYLEISKISSPSIAKRMGRSRKHPLREDWEEIKDEVMYFVVHTKVEQYEIVRNELLNETRDMEIVENSPKDSYWGCGKDGKGHNQLGKIFMRIRDEFRANPEEVLRNG
jgi:N-glycosidase YbiA